MRIQHRLAIRVDDGAARYRASQARTSRLMNSISSGLATGLPARWPQMLGIGRSDAVAGCGNSASLSAVRKYRSICPDAIPHHQGLAMIPAA
jgi:hypothetical protein